ncbi:amidase [Pseudomonas aeruginosa]|nr:amidase [Pseudomonas aeruginosa]
MQSMILLPIQEKETFAMEQEEFATYDAMGLADLVRTRQVSPLELAETAIQRIEAINPSINAVVHKTYERARERARQAPITGAFAGVPWLLKDISSAPGIPITMGSRALRGNVSQTSVPFVEAAEASGLNILGVTNVPEFGLLESTENITDGPARNPWHLDYSTGGSSGGAAAAVAAGMVPMAHGNDGGGSLRIPASHCGLFALKPSRGRTLAAHPQELPLGIGYDGVISRSVRDTAMFLSVVEDPRTRLPKLGFVENATQQRLRIGLLLAPGNGVAVDPQVADAFQSTAKLCEELGHHVEPVRLPFDHKMLTDTFFDIWKSLATISVDMVTAATGLEADDAHFEAWTLKLREDALRSGGPAALVKAAEPMVRDFAERLDAFMQHWDVVLSPVVEGTVPSLGLREIDADRSYEQLLGDIRDFVSYTPMHNICGTPAMSVPLHMDRQGLPIGSHFFSRAGREDTLIRLAYELEQARPWSARRPVL